jgi:hypothetical protein
VTAYTGFPRRTPCTSPSSRTGRVQQMPRQPRSLRVASAARVTTLRTARNTIHALPAGSGFGGYSCHALSVPTCTRVAVLIGDPAAAVASLSFSTPDTIPLIPHGWPLPKASTPRVGRFNARHWTVSPTEFIPQILSAAGITSSDARIFISYRTTESQELCDQLFEALNHAVPACTDPTVPLPGYDICVDL